MSPNHLQSIEISLGKETINMISYLMKMRTAPGLRKRSNQVDSSIVNSYLQPLFNQKMKTAKVLFKKVSKVCKASSKMLQMVSHKIIDNKYHLRVIEKQIRLMILRTLRPR